MFGWDDAAAAGLSIVNKIIDRVWQDPQEADKAKLELLKMQQSGELADLQADMQTAIEQIKVNAVSAQSPSLLVAGARPLIMWVCGVALAYTYILQPFIVFLVQTISLWSGHAYLDLSTLPQIAWGDLSVLLCGILGLGGFRTYEKLRGVATK